MDRPEYIVLFDGVCNLCNNLVQFLIKRDKKNIFKFAPLQSKIGQEILNENNMSLSDLNTFVFYVRGKAYTKSRAGIRVLGKLGGVWSLMYFFLIFPPFLRDIVYNLIANNRYRWWGKQESCMMPTPQLKAKFIA